MLAALPSCRAEISSTPFATRACEILKLAVPSSPKQRRAPYDARSRARTAATVGVVVMSPPVSHGPCRLKQVFPAQPTRPDALASASDPFLPAAAHRTV